MSTLPIAAGIVALFILALLVGIGVAITKMFVKVPQGQALVISTMREKVNVTFTGKVVLPVFHKAEVMDLTVKTIELDRRNQDGLICKDNIRADISVRFYVRVNKEESEVIKVAQSIGCARASDQGTLEALFNAKFAEALKTVGKAYEFEDLFTNRHEFRDAIIEVVGTDLNGYVLEDVAIDYLEQTPVAMLDENNILDAQGIRKITERTAVDHIATNVARRDEEKAITEKDVTTREAVLELERQQAEAEARQARQVATVAATEAAETARVEAEQRRIAEEARIATAEAIGVRTENQERQVAVARIDRERVVAVETENVERDRQVAVVNRDVAVTETQRTLEDQMASTAARRAERVAVERDVAAKEEEIASLRVVEDAKRHKDATVLTAEGEARAGQVREIAVAQAAEEAAAHRAKERVTLAQAGRDAAELDAAAQIRLADATKATEAAPGLAAVEVKAADAEATKALGFAEAEVRAKAAEAAKVEGFAEADVVRETGKAKGEALETSLKGEAAGTLEKAAALRELEGVGQDFEQFRLDLEMRRDVALAEVDAQVNIARHRADAVAASMANADVSIVGGTDLFVNQMLGATTKGEGVDRVLESSENLGRVFAHYTDGDGNLVADVAHALGGNGAAAVQHLTVSAFLGQMMASAKGANAERLGAVLDAVKAQGLDQTTIGDLLK